MKESQIEKQIREYAISKGCTCEKFIYVGKRGATDRALVSPYGVTGFLEIKKPGGDVHSKQERERKRLRKRNCPADIVDNLDDGKAFVDYLLTLRVSTV